MSWNILVEDKDTYNVVKNKIDDIYQLIANYYDKKQVGLLGGYGGCLLFLYYYYKFTQKEEHLLVLMEKCNMVFEDFVSTSHSTYCSGYSGICWLIRFLANQDVIDAYDTDDYLEEVDRFIHHSILLCIKNRDFDYLHGGLGMAYYFSTQKNKNGVIAMQDFLSALDNNKITNLDASVKWLSNVYINKHEQVLACNLGLAHGMASIMALLIKQIESNTNVILSRKLLDRTVHFYINKTNPSTCRSVFPPWIHMDTNGYSESRLAWCYGDLGISYVLYRAAISLNDSELTKFALNILIKCSERKDYRVDNIVDACICHGTSGICHIFNRMYQKTDLTIFKKTAMFWLGETLKMGEVSNQLAGFHFVHDGEYSSNFSILTGLSGVGLSLLATIDSTEPCWDECLTLS